MKTNPNRFWSLVILLGWAFDFLFWKKPTGVNFAIYVILCLVTGILILRVDGHRPKRNTWLLFVPIAFLTAMTFIRAEPMTVFLSYAMTLLLMGVVALTYLNGLWPWYGIFDYVFGFLRLAGSMIARPLGFVAEIRRDQLEMGQKRKFPVWPVLRGVVIALPVVAIFASLLSSADVVFAKRLNDFIRLFNLENLPEYIFRLVYILIFAYALAGTFLHAAQSKDDKLIGVEKPLIPPFLGSTEAGIVLGSVIVLFAAFVAVQFQYFFGGQTNIHIEGYTYSEYARRGFGELVIVALFSLLLLLGMGAVTHRETERQRNIFSGLGVGMVVLVIVMLVSAYQRLVLYENAYGFSRLRTYTHVFMIWLGLLLVAVVVLEILHRERAFGFTAVLASLGFVISLNLLNVDAFIVKRNVEREIHGIGDRAIAQGRADLDAQYFLDLSDDAVPTLVDAYQTSNLPAMVKDKLGASLACIRYQRSPDKRVRPWQSFHFSHFYADRALQSVESDLSGYKITDKDRPVKVTTPAGEEFSCWQYYYD